MKKSKQETNARIIPFKKSHATHEADDVSEVTRSLFSDTWRTYLDQVSMAAIKLDPSPESTEHKQPEITTTKLTLVDVCPKK